MKKKTVSLLKLNRETLRMLGDAKGTADLGAVAPDNNMIVVALSIPVCTQVVSDCKYCTTPLDGCNRTIPADGCT